MSLIVSCDPRLRLRAAIRMNLVVTVLALGTSVVRNAAAADLPVHVLTTPEIAALATVPAISLSTLSFRTVASATVSVPTQEDAKTVKPVTARATNAVAAAYQSLPHSNPPMLPPLPSGADVFDFKLTADSAQAWSTMTASGIPYVFLQGSGEFEASATTSWVVTLRTPQNQPSTEVIVRFTLPAAKVGGTFEQDGPALYQSRLRAELLADGYPVWSTEALGFNRKTSTGGENFYRQSFGTPLVFPTSPTASSSPLPVYLSLGVYPADRPITLSMILRSDTRTVDDPAVAKSDNQCVVDADNEYFCTRGEVTVAGSANNPVGFYMRPAP